MVMPWEEQSTTTEQEQFVPDTNIIPIITADDVEKFYAIRMGLVDDFRYQEVPVNATLSILSFIAIHKSVRLSAAGKQHEAFQYEKLAYVYGEVADKL